MTHRILARDALMSGPTGTHGGGQRPGPEFRPDPDRGSSTRLLRDAERLHESDLRRPRRQLGSGRRRGDDHRQGRRRLRRRPGGVGVAARCVVHPAHLDLRRGWSWGSDCPRRCKQLKTEAALGQRGSQTERHNQQKGIAMNVSEVLNKAADLIEERGWTVGNCGMTATGPMCMEGAIADVMGIRMRPHGAFGRLYSYSDVQATAAYQAVKVYLAHRGVKWAWQWNDTPGRTAVEVIETLRAAALIEAAKEMPVSIVTPEGRSARLEAGTDRHIYRRKG